VSGAKSFSTIRPWWRTRSRKVTIPELPYGAGQAIIAQPAIMLPLTTRS
jgi:hypothetical protein